MIETVLAFNDVYCRYAASVMLSILKHAAPQDRFRFHLLGSGIREESRRRLEAALAHPAAELCWGPVRMPEGFRRIRRPEGVSEETFLRLLLPELLPDTARVIYLDCDVIAMDSLAPLWNADLHGALLGGVPDYNTRLADHARALGLEPGSYMNAGVLLMDLERIRRAGPSAEQLVLPEEKLSLLTQADQDLLNLIYAGRIAPLELRWNLSGGFFKHEVKEAPLREKLIEAMRRPGILHFTSSRKPWTFRTTRHPFWEEYFRAVRGTVYAQEFRYFLKKYLLPKDRSVLPQ